MATPTGSHLGKNPFKKAMSSSVPNAVEISQSLVDSLTIPAETNEDIEALLDYYSPKNTALQQEAALQKANVIFRTSATKQLVLTIKGEKAELTDWIKQISDVYPKDTEEYDRLLIDGASSFYVGSRTNRLIRINALITAIGSDASLATVKAQIQVYATALAGKKATQSVDKQKVSDDSVDVSELVNDCANGLWYVYCGLIQLNIEHPEVALAFFPMQLIYKASNEKRYTLLVPAHIIKKICIHTFKTGETVTLTNNSTQELKVGLASAAKGNVLVWYTLAPSQTVTINPNLLGNLTNRYVMVKNESLTERGDITFVINVA